MRPYTSHDNVLPFLPFITHFPSYYYLSPQPCFSCLPVAPNLWAHPMSQAFGPHQTDFLPISPFSAPGSSWQRAPLVSSKLICSSALRVTALLFHPGFTELKAINILAIKKCFTAVWKNRQTSNTHPQMRYLYSWQTIASLCVCAAGVTSPQGEGTRAFLLMHWWPIFILYHAIQRQKKVRLSEGAFMINWSALPVPECRLELEHSGSQS